MLRFNRRDFSRTVPLAINAVILALFAPWTHADGPGMLLTPSNYRPEELFLAPFARFRGLAEIGSLPTNGGLYAAILETGRPAIFGGVLGTPYRAIPPGANDLIQLALGSNYMIAIAGSGQTVTWPSRPVWLPSEPLKDLSASSNAIAAVGASGAVYVWNPTIQLTTNPSLPLSEQVSISLNWGVLVSADGTALTFGYGGTTPPGSFSATGVLDASAGGSISAPRAVVIRGDGSLASLTTSFTDTRRYEKVRVGPSTLVALESSGKARSWVFAPAVGDWTAPFEYTGRFQDIALAPLGSSPIFICASDTDQNGENDRDQIIRGEIPDVNGDLVDDRVQGSNILRDEDANGIVDAAECAAIAHRHRPADSVWTVGGTGKAAFFALDRVPVQAETLRWARLNHLAEGANGGTVVGTTIEYGVWLDPNGDGSPADAVEVFKTPVTLQKNRLAEVDLGGLWIGPPGTVFFHGFVYPIGQGLVQPALFPAQSLPTGSTDPLHLSRWRARCWFGGSDASAPNTPAIQLVRTASPWEQVLGYPALSSLSVSWNDRAATDCNGDGMIDSFSVGGQHAYWFADPDINRNGVIDTCEQDCDADSIFDVSEIIAGAVDCDLDLVPDACGVSTFSTEQTVPVPAPASPSEFVFNGLPQPGGPVSVRIDAVADLGAPTELLVYRFEDGQDTAIFAATGSDCPVIPDNTTFSYTPVQFAAALTDGVIRIRIGTSALVDPAQCPTGYIKVRIEYLKSNEDCDANGSDDACQNGPADCDGNGIPDACELNVAGRDLDANGVLDACEFDCNHDSTPDALQIMANPSLDCDGSGYLDECEFIDCNQNGLNDACDLLNGATDCNQDGVLDICQILADCNSDGIPDACESDCDANGTPDVCDTANGAPDKDQDGLPDACEYARGDFDLDGAVGAPDLAYLLSVWGATGISIGDLNGDGVIGAQDLTIFLSRWGPA